MKIVRRVYYCFGLLRRDTIVTNGTMYIQLYLLGIPLPKGNPVGFSPRIK